MQVIESYFMDLSMGWAKDSFITQDRNEQIKGIKVEATFSRGHISLT